MGQLLKIRENDVLIKELCGDKNYKINEYGSILTLIQVTGKVSVSNNWRSLVGDITSDGYVRYRYKYKYLSAHRIVYQKFIGELDFNKQINHIDGDRKNNHFSNLELVTQSENVRHSYTNLKRPPAISFKKANFQIAQEIRIERALGISYSCLASKFGLSKTTIYDILKNKTWSKKSEFLNV